MEKQRVQTPDESTPYAIEMLHITKRFPGIIANDDITLQLRHGEIHALLGENGAGKSTLALTLAGLLKPIAGKVLIADNLKPAHAGREPIDWKSIRNDVSNENAKLDESLRDDRGTNTAALNDAADAAQERMRANREAYERGLAEAEAIRRRRERTAERGESSDRKVQGRVTVSFSLVDPVRHARHLVVPAYQCEGGGEVVVRITVNRAGEVTHASVASGGDDCMRETAVRAARNSVFDINDAAPARHTGTITYIFIPQ